MAKMAAMHTPMNAEGDGIPVAEVREAAGRDRWGRERWGREAGSQRPEHLNVESFCYPSMPQNRESLGFSAMFPTVAPGPDGRFLSDFETGSEKGAPLDGSNGSDGSSVRGRDSGGREGSAPSGGEQARAAQSENELNAMVAEQCRKAEARGSAKGAESGMAAGMEQGLQRGLLEGAERAKGERERLEQQVAALISSFEQERGRYFKAVEKEAVYLAMAIAARILRREAQMDPLLLTGAVRVALGQLAERTEVRLHVPHQDYPLWQEAMDAIPGLGLRPQVVSEEWMELGDCRVETELGSTDLGLKAQLQEIERGFFDRVGPKTGSGRPRNSDELPNMERLVSRSPAREDEEGDRTVKGRFAFDESEGVFAGEPR